MIRRLLKWLGIVLLTPIIIFVLIFTLLYVPPVQNYIRKEATVYASDAIGMQIGIERISLSFPLNLVVKGVEVVSKKDTLLSAERLMVKVQLLPLIWKKIEINGVGLENVKVNTADLIDGMNISGSLEELFLESHGVDLTKEEIVVNKVNLRNADVKLCLNDTVKNKPDTVSTPVNWKILLHKLTINNVLFTLQMPEDSLNLFTKIDNASLINGEVDLKKQLYRLAKLRIGNSEVNYDSGSGPIGKGFDPSHIMARKINMEIDSLKYCGLEIAGLIHQLSLTERSGLEIKSLEGQVKSDSLSFSVPSLRLETPFSFVDLSAFVDLKTKVSKNKGVIFAKLDADIGKQDVLLFAGNISKDLEKEYPFRPLILRANIEGNIQKLQLKELRAELPGAFRLFAKGNAEAVLDSISRAAHVDLEAETGNIDFILSLLDAKSRADFAIPHGMKLAGKADMKGQAYSTDMAFTKGLSKILLNAEYDNSKKSYRAKLDVDSLQLLDFMPKDSLYGLTASITAKGQGFDFFSKQTFAEVDARVNNFHYAKYDLSGIELSASLSKSVAKIVLDSHNPLVDMQAKLNALLSKKKIEADLDMQVANINFHRLRMTDKPFDISLNCKLKAASDLNITHDISGSITEMRLITPERIFKPKDVLFDAATSLDSTSAMVSAGDLKFSLDAKGSIEYLIKESNLLATALTKQLKEKHLDQNELRKLFPGACLRISAGNDNPLSNYLSARNITFDSFLMDIDTSPAEGINGNSYLYALRTDSLQLDTIKIDIRQDTTGVKFAAGVINGPQNKQIVFKATADGELYADNGQLLLKYYDAKGNNGVLLGIRAVLREEGVSFHLFPERPTIVFKPFNLNKDNYVYIGKDKRIRADISLLDKDGMGLRLYSLPDTTALQDISVELRRIELAAIQEVAPYMPEISGLINAEAHYVQTEQSLQIAADVRVDKLTYEQNKIGNVELGAVYLPGDGDEHHLAVHLSHNDIEVLNAGGVYHTSGKGVLDADVTLEHFPLNLANGFIPEHMVELVGDMDGEFNVKGELTKPNINGQLTLDSVSVKVPQYGAHFRLDNRPIRLENSNLVFDKFNIYTRGSNPFSINGNVDVSDFKAMTADLKLSANNYELVNAPKKKESLVYGKIFVDFGATVKGPLDELVMRGSVNLLGNTNVTYIVKDSPLTAAQDRLGELVTFVNFNDTTQVQQEQTPIITLGGLDMLMVIHIDQVARVNADLNADGSNYVRLEGGGDLSLQYTQFNGLLLSGRYTLTSGSMKYGLMGVTREFSIQNGSYVDWSGNPIDPSLNLTAIYKKKASVALDEQQRMVNFESSIIIKNQLENLSVAFNLSAPEDATIQNELSAMSDEERNKQAIAMIVTGSYLGSGGSSGFNMGNSLNGLLNSAIQGVTNNIKAVDINLGVETSDGTNKGNAHTDYSFQVSKRFWNDRFNIIVGGKISTGDNVQQSNQTFIDNISVEYRLDNSGTRYIKLFHDKNYDSILDGEITETGIGIVLRKKMSRLVELFIFRKKKIESNRNK